MQRHLLAHAVGAMLAATTLASPAAWPERPIKLVTPFQPGGQIGIVAYALSIKLSASLGQPVVMEARPGAAGTIAATMAAKASKDGYTVLFATSGMLGVAKYAYKDLQYDPVADFAPVSYLGNVLIGVFASPKSGIDSLATLVSQARAKPGQINFGSPGIGSASHLAAELFKSRAGLDIVHVPYPGNVPQMVDLAAGVTQLTFGGAASGMSYVKDGRAWLIAVASQKRSTLYPDVPAIGEVLPGYDGPAWVGLVVPKGTPQEVIDRIAAATNDALKDREFRQLLDHNGIEHEAMSSRAFGDKIRREMGLWEEAAKAAGLQGSAK